MRRGFRGFAAGDAGAVRGGTLPEFEVYADGLIRYADWLDSEHATDPDRKPGAPNVFRESARLLREQAVELSWVRSQNARLDRDLKKWRDWAERFADGLRADLQPKPHTPEKQRSESHPEGTP